MAEEYVDTLLDKDDAELDKFLDEYLGDLRLTKKQAGAILGIIKGVGICSYLAGLEAGKEIEKEYVKNNAFTSMKEQGLFPFGKWHDINDTEPSKEQLGKQLLIRLESVIGDTDYDYLVYKYSGESITDVPGVIAWCEIPKYTDKE